MQIEQAVFTVIDLETSSLAGDNIENRICEIAAIKTQNEGEIDRFHSLVNPQCQISLSAYNIHKISNDMIKEAPTFHKLGSKICEFIKGTVIVAHNTAFDVRVLNSEFRRIGLSIWNGPCVDTVKLARQAFSQLAYRNLDALSFYLNIDVKQRHRSLGDCEATVKILWECIKQLKTKGRVNNLMDLVKAGRNRKLEQDFTP